MTPLIRYREIRPGRQALSEPGDQAALDNQAKRRQFRDLVLMYVNISRPENDLRPSGERQGEGRADGPLSLRQKHGAGKQARAAYGGGIIVRQVGQRLVEQEGVRSESQG